MIYDKEIKYISPKREKKGQDENAYVDSDIAGRIFQLLTFVAVLVFGGEFENIRQYAYNTLVEKTENRGIYIQNELQEKPTIVQEYAEQINNIVVGILEEHVSGAGVTYAAYVASHTEEWTNIMTNLGFFWADASVAAPEPHWETWTGVP